MALVARRTPGGNVTQGGGMVARVFTPMTESERLREEEHQRERELAREEHHLAA